MQINYDFPWYLQNSEGFMTMYTGLFNVATTISPISFLSCLDVDHAEYPQQIKTIAMLYGLRGDWVGIEDALIYDVKRWSVGGSHDLPSGYRELLYVTAAGSQYIDTGLTITQEHEIRSKFKPTTNSYLYGALSNGNTASVSAFIQSSGGYWRFGNTGVTKAVSLNSIHTSTQNVSSVTIDGAPSAYSTIDDFETPVSLVVGTAHTATGTYSATGFVGDIYGVSVYNGDTAVIDLVPCRRTSDDSIGFYDTVSDRFFENIGSGDFVAGPNYPGDDGEVNYWSGKLADTLDLLTNYIKAKVQIRNKNLTLQSLKQFFAVCLAHRNFDPDTAISVTESTLHFDLEVAVDEGVLNDMVTLLSVDPWPFGKPTGISYSINYVQQ